MRSMEFVNTENLNCIIPTVLNVGMLQRRDTADNLKPGKVPYCIN